MIRPGIETGANLTARLLNGYAPLVGQDVYVLSQGTVAGCVFNGYAQGSTIALGTGVTATGSYQANWTGGQLTSTPTLGNDVASIVRESPVAAVPGPAAIGLIALTRVMTLRRRR